MFKKPTNVKIFVRKDYINFAITQTIKLNLKI